MQEGGLTIRARAKNRTHGVNIHEVTNLLLGSQISLPNFSGLPNWGFLKPVIVYIIGVVLLSWLEMCVVLQTYVCLDTDVQRLQWSVSPAILDCRYLRFCSVTAKEERGLAGFVRKLARAKMWFSSTLLSRN